MHRIVPSQVVEVIDRIFPAAKGQKDTQHGRFTVDRSYQNELAAIVALYDQIPSELLILGPNDYTDLQLSVTAIKNCIPSWHSRNFGLERIHGHSNLNPITILRNALSKCPDEGILEATVDLPFISDQEFGDNLRIDISSANQAFQNGEWKATTILAGATIEAILLYVMYSVQNSDPSKISESINALVSNGTFSRSPGKNLDRWSLHVLTEIATNLGMIREETATQIRIARDFRNLIHPGVSVRKNIVCNRGTALSALAGLEHTINDVSANSP